MAGGDLYEVDDPSVSDIYYLDTGMYGTAEYGALYVVDAPEPALVDTGLGTESKATLTALAELGIDRDELAYIIPTHVHLDHAGGASYLAEACESATIVCHKAGARHLTDPARLWAGTKAAVGKQIEFYRKPKPVDPDRIREVSGGGALDLGDRRLDVYDSPGHAPHQMVLHSPSDNATFVADAAGIYAQRHDVIRPTSPPSDFDLEACLSDIDTLRELDPAVLLYAHYGPAATGEKLDRYERILTRWVAEIEAARDHLEDDDAVVETVARRVEPLEPWDQRKVYTEAAMNVRGVLDYLDSRSM
jgi:glyoxylase-like metal-dependent hydrolase (beta-lactamase superfamily II)